MPKKIIKQAKSKKNSTDSESDSDDGLFSPSLSEASAITNVDPNEYDVNYKIQSIQSLPFMELSNFLNNPKLINPPGAASTNIIDRYTKKCYNVPDKKIPSMFKYIELCRRESIKLMMTERQLEYSGIMLDFDIYQDTEDDQLTDMLFNVLSQKIVDLLSKLLKIEDKKPIYIGITRRPKITYSEEKECFKDGFHMLIPSIKVRRGVKKLLINKLIENEIIDQIFHEVAPASIKINGEEYQKKDFLDINSAYVPVFFLGSSTKKGHAPYNLTHVYEITINTATGALFVINNNKILRGKHYNLCHEFSLNWEDPKGKIKKSNYEIVDKYLDEVNLLESKNQLVTDDNIAKNYGQLSTLIIHDTNAKEIKDLLDTLHISRTEDYGKWRDVIFALGNTATTYKPLAEYFSRKSKKFNAVDFEKMWNAAICKSASNKKMYTIASIYYWAKIDNPDRFDEIRKSSTDQVLYNMVYDACKEGMLSHADIATLLYKLLQHKYVVDVPEGTRSKTWYEFVLDEDECIDGELYKWREWKVLPTTLSNYISYVLPNLFELTFRKVKNKYETSDGDYSKYFAKVLQNFKATVRKLGDRNFKKNVICEAEDKFFKRGFAIKLDKDPLIRGVQNGVLKLTLAPGGKPMLIQGFHSHYVSKYTEVPYIPFDPYDELTKRMLIALRNMFPDEEPDSFEFTMYFLSSTIDGNPKESMFMIMTGSGANGKSFLVELHKGAIGSIYGVKMPLSYLTNRSSSADTATPAQMQLKDATFAYYSESNKHEKLNAARVKEVTGLETIAGRKLHQDMINFKPRCHHLVTTNYDFDIECNDYGTWRRIEYNPLKITFKDPAVSVIDSNNKYERKADPAVTQQWTEDPDVQGRYLGFMVWMHYWLYRKHHGKVKSVPHPHIQFETDKYRKRQDTISEFLSQKCVKCSDAEIMNPLTEQIQIYVAWYALNNGNAIPAKGISEQLQNSQIGKFIKLTARGWYLVGHRFLKNNDVPLEGETFAMRNVYDMQTPPDNFGIKSESSIEYYERVCREYDQHKHIFASDAKYDVDADTLLDWHVIGSSSDYESTTYTEYKKGNMPMPIMPNRGDNLNTSDDVTVLSSGIVLKKLEEPSINYLTDDYIDVSGMMNFLTNTEDFYQNGTSPTEDLTSEDLADYDNCIEEVPVSLSNALDIMCNV